MVLVLYADVALDPALNLRLYWAVYYPKHINSK